MYKLLDYDITEYKQLENTLNELSKQGYNPTSLGKISRFEKNEKHYYFHVDLLIKKPATPKRKALHDFINEYEKQMFDYYGKIGKFIIFTTDNKRALPKERQKAIDEYLSTRKISATTYFVLWIFFSFFVAQLVLQKNYLSGFNPDISIAHILPVRCSSVKGISTSGSAAPLRYNTSDADMPQGISTAKFIPVVFLLTPGFTGSPLYARILFCFSISGSPCNFCIYFKSISNSIGQWSDPMISV